jgi:glycosyltransferase involved in cell wall biosynthesis
MAVSANPGVLIINSTLSIGGAEQVAAWLASRLDRGKFSVQACYLKKAGQVATQMLSDGVDLMPLPGLRTGKKDYFSFLKLRRLVRARGIRIIHTHDIHGLVVGSLCRLVTPSLRHVHTFHFGNYPHLLRKWQWIEGTLWRIPDALIAVGREQAASIRAIYRVPENRLRVVWNGADDPRKRQQAAAQIEVEGLRKGVPIIGSVSTMIKQKGIEHLLNAAKILRDTGEDFHLLIAGDGPLREAVRSRVTELSLDDHVRCLGWVPQASDRLLPMCDMFVQSSIWEAMSVVVLEAMAAGKPMVVTSVGENPHVVIDGETGIIVPPANPAALAEGLRRLLRDPGLRQRMGEAGRQRYDRALTVRHMIEAHQKLYADLLQGANS